MTVSRPAPRPGILDISPYVPGKSGSASAGRVFKLSSNESPIGPSPEAVRAFAALPEAASLAAANKRIGNILKKSEAVGTAVVDVKLLQEAQEQQLHKALQAVETFFWRAGDLLSSVVVLIVVRWLSMSARGFAFVNLALVAIWLFLAWNLSRENRRLTAKSEPAAA